MKNQKSKIKNFLFLICILHLSSFIFHLPKAYAEALGLRVSPSLIKIKTPAPSEINSPLSIENPGDTSLNLDIRLKLFKDADGNGQPEYLSDKENHSDIFSKIKIFEKDSEIKSLSLGPRQKKDLALIISIPEKEAISDYYFSVVFITASNSDQAGNNQESGGQTSFTNINTGIATNVLLSILPKTKNTNSPVAVIEEFSAPSTVQSGPLPFTVKIHNNDTNYINPKGNITITNMFGQTIGKVDIPPTNILANSSRYLSSNRLNPKPYTSPRGEAGLYPEVLWQENFLLGFYTAELTIQPSPDTPALTQTIRFTALPSKLIIGIVLAIILFLLIRKRVKAKMSQ